MKIDSIVNNDLANGPGIRTTIFVSGCPHHCPECHNPELWDKSVGTEVSDRTIHQLISLLTENGVHRGFSVLGGEPLAPYNIEGVTEICRAIKEALPNVDIWLWTGYDFDEKNFCDIIITESGSPLQPRLRAWRGAH